MPERVAVRDVDDLYLLTVWHEVEDGEPACRQSEMPGTSYQIVDLDALPEGVTECDFCAGEHTPTNTFRDGILAQELDEADPEEVSAR